MALNGIKRYTPDVGKLVIDHKFNDLSVEELSQYERWFIIGQTDSVIILIINKIMYSKA